MVEGNRLVNVAIIRTEYDVGLEHYIYVLFTDTTRGIVVKSVDEVTYKIGAEAGSNRTTVELVAIARRPRRGRQPGRTRQELAITCRHRPWRLLISCVSCLVGPPMGPNQWNSRPEGHR